MSRNHQTPARFAARLPILASALAVAVVLAGCVDSGGRDADPQADYTVTIRDTAYHPAELRVPVGSSVLWKNEDAVQHTVSAMDPAQWGTAGSGDEFADWLNRGDTWMHTFNAPGEYGYYCHPHAWQTGDEWQGQLGKIIVE